MLYLISYDIPSDKPGDRRRARIARMMEGYGVRVQLSVFECEMAPVTLTRLREKIIEILDLSTDNVRIYTICATCHAAIDNIGVDDPIQRDHDCMFL